MVLHFSRTGSGLVIVLLLLFPTTTLNTPVARSVRGYVVAKVTMVTTQRVTMVTTQRVTMVTVLPR